MISNQQSLNLSPFMAKDGSISKELIQNPYFAVNDTWNIEFFSLIKNFKEQYIEYKSGNKNLRFSIKEAGVAKATLYNHRELCERIKTLRQQQIQASTAKQIKREMNENNKDALIESLKRKIRKLEDENKQLVCSESNFNGF